MLHNLRSDKSLLCDPVLALNRDSVKGKSNSTSESTAASGGPASAAATAGKNSSKTISESQNDQTAHKLVALYNLVESQKSTLQRLTSCLSEADKQRSALLKDLEDERRKNIELTKKSKENEQQQQALTEESKNGSDPQVIFFCFQQKRFRQTVMKL